MERIPESIFGLESSSIDTNRFYSILLDAKAATVSENMCDITEKLLHGEKENAKAALEQLWNLKKNLVTQAAGTLDMVIGFYQDKMDILRNKEEHIKKISKDSRTLLEEKRKKDEEVAVVKQQINECTKEINELTQKLQKLQIKEQELILIDDQLKKELQLNENEIVNGLYEIMLSQQEQEIEYHSNSLATSDIANIPDALPESKVEDTSDKLIVDESKDSPDLTVSNKKEPVNDVLSMFAIEKTENSEELISSVQESLQIIPIPEIVVYPKALTKMKNGRIIGEYYYDNKVYKNERHYIFNGKFFCDQLAGDIKFLLTKFDSTIYSEVQRMISDVHPRITENKMYHFEVSTNEILNDKTLKQLWQDAQIRNFGEIERFCNRMKAKIEALGNNYKIMLQEQMVRCTAK
jgi:hypothetical protein